MPRSRSPIEKSFHDACLQRGITFDHEEQVSRYRADFLDKGRKLVIELDGHENHKSQEDRTNDARRDRQLHRDGFTVLRFTGSEIFHSLSRCIDEVEQTLALMQPISNPKGAVYIDWLFLDRLAFKSFQHYSTLYPDKNIEELALSRFLDLLATYLKLAGRFDVHLFGTASSFSTSLIDIDALKLRKAHRALFNVTEHQHEFLAIALVEHLHKEGTLYDYIVFVGDDGAYPPLLTRGRSLDIILRRDNSSTNMASVQARRWQDIEYVIGYCFGLATHEL